ncbi:hypothetical protein C7974DRAFT_407461 [Boeremia exigua]|uniref:uncharacterized protein n=1 Tax=Boeremia exigua TaxID=749465 RepID=UPI001E8E09A9|nr:uncharacterized protein C7974DRAFT_407461 [Boeremia exigua]KAH6643747.1 hypothetical protein C7974DRAFT_407461 [Boeremia exigua]
MEDFDENDEMAAMMGFSSFGGNKKRKFDHTKSPAKDDDTASGANSTELGMRTKELDNQQTSGRSTLSAAAPAKEPSSADGLARFLARGQALPEKPPAAAPGHDVDTSASELVSFGGPSISRAELNALRFGAKNADGDTAYFLPSFVEDPWAKLLPSHT